jgi:hypothetical protein
MAHIYGPPAEGSPAATTVTRSLTKFDQQRVVKLCEELLDAPSLMLHKGALELTRLLGKTVTVDMLDDVVDVVLHESGALLKEAERLDQRAASCDQSELAQAYAGRAAAMRKRDAAVAALPADTRLGPRAVEKAELLAKADAALRGGYRDLAEGYQARAAKLGRRA